MSPPCEKEQMNDKEQIDAPVPAPQKGKERK